MRTTACRPLLVWVTLLCGATSAWAGTCPLHRAELRTVESNPHYASTRLKDNSYLGRTYRVRRFSNNFPNACTTLRMGSGPTSASRGSN
jgi:hypothetical protein